MTNECLKNKRRNYQCIDGTCTSSYFLCESPKPPHGMSCPSYGKDYYCPNTKWCEFEDWYCPRRCGFQQDSYVARKYNVACNGFPGLCFPQYRSCPPVCSDAYPYKCLKKRKCVKNKNYCATCYGFRCRSDGKCIDSYRKCNSVNDCSDGSDEQYCTSGGTDSDGPGLENWHIGLIVGGVLLFMLLCCIWMCRKCSDDDGDATTTNVQQGQTGSSGGPLMTGATPTRAPPSVQVRGAYDTPYPSYSPRPPGQSQGEYLAMAPAPTSNTTGAAGASMPSAPPPSAPPADGFAAPPPSYFDVVDNEEQYKPKDPMLPSYEQVSGYPPSSGQQPM